MRNPVFRHASKFRLRFPCGQISLAKKNSNQNQEKGIVGNMQIKRGRNLAIEASVSHFLFPISQGGLSDLKYPLKLFSTVRGNFCLLLANSKIRVWFFFFGVPQCI